MGPLFDLISFNSVNAIATLVTAIATTALVFATFALTKETIALREQGRCPELIVYLEIDFGSDAKPMAVVLENVGNAPAYDVKIEWSPDQLVNPIHNDLPPDPNWSFHLSTMFINDLPMVPPGRKYLHEFSALNNGTGHLKPYVEVDAIAHVRYRTREGHVFNEKLRVTSDNIKYCRVSTSRRAAA